MVKTVLANVAGVIDSLKNIAWHDKSSCDVLIFDVQGSDLIQHCIPLGAKVNVLRVREGGRSTFSHCSCTMACSYPAVSVLSIRHWHRMLPPTRVRVCHAMRRPSSAQPN